MMINRKDTPAPFVQRGPPPNPLGLKSAAPSSTSHTNTDPQTPQTPKNKIRTKRASRVQHRQTPHETYIDSNARAVGNENSVRDERISHDLSLTDNGRHSVVDNMLMSLNPDQSKPSSPPKDRPTYTSGSEATAPPASSHRRLHSSSTNSDFSPPYEDSPQRIPSQYPRGRRSNSSTGFQPALGRIDSVNAEREAGGNSKGKGQALGAGSEGPVRPLWTVRKHSKSSGSSSVDLGHMGPSRFTLSHKRRSASFDLNERARVLHSASSSETHPSIPSGGPRPLVYDDLEAAPTPTVPAGPRKDRSPLFPPHTGSSVPAPQRRNSNKSSRGQPNRRKKADDNVWEPLNPPPSNTFAMGSKRASKQMPPSPGILKSRTQSPSRQFSEPQMAQRLEPNTPAKDTTSERPGFFRRMFGSSRNDMHLLQTQPPKGTTRASSREGFYSTQKTSKAPTLDTAPQPQQNAPPLVKKPSSFFRRRKKSVSEAMPPPSLPLHLNSNPPPQVESAQRSPTSSLRQVMNPYLDNPMRSDARQFAGTVGHDNAHSQTHTLTAKGSTEPARRDQDQDPRQDAYLTHSRRQPRDLPSSRREVPNEQARLKSDDAYYPKANDNSFFHDDSSNETRIPGVSDDTELSRPGTVNLAQAPSSFPADMKPRTEISDRSGKSREGREPLYERAADRSIDPPRHCDVLSARNGNLPPSPRITPTKPDAREWLTNAQMTPSRNQLPTPGSAKDTDRMWLQPGGSDCDIRKQDARKQETSFPFENAEVSPISDYHSTKSNLQPLKLKNDIHFPEPTAEDVAHKLSVEIDDIQPTDAERQQAKQLFDGDESLVEKSMVGPWLGDPDPSRGRIRKAYMELFDWQSLSILAALRSLCDRMYLKGEAQQVDRVLDAFSTRWCACNPDHGFKATDVIHTICYSLILLNTDLHQSQIETKMTRTQFLKNILPTIRRVVTDAAPDAFVNPRASTLPPVRPWVDAQRPSIKSPTSQEAPELRRSFEGQRPIYRLSQRPSDQTAYSTQPYTPVDFNTAGDCGPLVKTPFHGKLSTWENQVEVILKDFYYSIRQQKLPLHGSESTEPVPETPTTANSLSAMTSGMLRRTPSVLSKAGSENLSYSRGRPSDSRLGTGKWQSKNRSRPRLYPASSVATSRRSSLDEQSSVTSPSVTSAWSKFSSLGKTQTSMSTDSFASHFPQGDYQQSVGFANALSQAIIREEGTGADEESLRAAPMLEDESLELAGAPWAKEGILKHKHHLDAPDKRAKDRNWVESFAVIEKGYMRLFSFTMNAKSLRQKAKQQKANGNVVGGGNWADSAETLGTFLLRQTIAIALPPPGYSKTRPHVWALNLPTGAVHLFQVGTPEIVKEFVTTANYWSARLSKEPMVGGISNIEYGWGEQVINTALINPDRNNSTSTSAMNNPGARPSLQSSIRSARSSIDQGAFRPRLPGDKIMISDWTPPQQSLVASVLMEVDQLKGLWTYVKNIEEELEKHNELRAALLLAFSPRHPNSTKAMTNWERKSSYLLHEIVKFKTYIDCLEAAQKQKEKIYAEREKVANPAGEEPSA